MKFIQVALAGFLAIASVEVVALPHPGRRLVPYPYCCRVYLANDQSFKTGAIANAKTVCNNGSGQPCHNVERVTTESLAEPVGNGNGNEKRDPKRRNHPWCWLPGEVCRKAKRDDDQSYSQVKEGNPWCWMPGQICTKTKRQLEEPEAAFWKKL